MFFFIQLLIKYIYEISAWLLIGTLLLAGRLLLIGTLLNGGQAAPGTQAAPDWQAAPDGEKAALMMERQIVVKIEPVGKLLLHGGKCFW